MDDVGVLKAADDMHDGVHLADVRKELVAQPLALRGAADQPRNVHKLDGRGGVLFGFINLGERVEPFVRHGDHADVRLNGTEGVIRALGARVGQRIEQRALADVGQSDDP